MQRPKTFKRGRLVLVLMAGGIGYLIGGWQTVALHSADLSAAEAVAQRFPQAWQDASAVTKASAASSAINMSAASPSAARTMGDTRLALFSPVPMVPQVVPPQALQAAAENAPQAVAPPTVQMAALEQAGPSPLPMVTAPPRPPAAAQTTDARTAVAAAAAAAAARHRANRPGYLLDDAQIASIKHRLNLTPDQEQMWPAVEAALRNIAYAKAKEEHRRGSADTVQAAAVDPDSAEVQGLKSAAVPLIMSFNSEQKEEVRNLAHVMGLDQLATQF
jgi:hypothetical protein